MYVGSTKPADREIAARDGRVLFATYSIAQEGLDIPALDALVLATPIGDTEQAVGRILRKYPEKRTALVLDTYSVFAKLAHIRNCFYIRNKYRTTYHDLEDHSPRHRIQEATASV